MLAQSSGTIDDAEAALADAVLVKRVMPDTLRSFSLAADSQVCAAAAYRRAGRMDQWDEHLAAADREAEALMQFPNNQEALLVRAYVAAVRDGLAGQTNLLDELRRSQKSKKNSGLASQEAMNLFILGRDEQAAGWPKSSRTIARISMFAFSSRSAKSRAAMPRADRKTPDVAGHTCFLRHGWRAPCSFLRVPRRTSRPWPGA